MPIDNVNTQLVTVSVDAIIAGTPEGSSADLTCLLSLGDYSQERGKTEYSCMSSNDSTVGLGTISRSPMDFEVLYSEIAASAQAKLKAAFNANTNVEITIEFDNDLGANGTQLKGEFGISKFLMPFPKDGKIGATFTGEFMSAPTLIEAAAV